jgi:hypothetical protein
MTQAPTPTPDHESFSKLYAVVLRHHAGMGRVYWSHQHVGWRPGTPGWIHAKESYPSRCEPTQADCDVALALVARSSITCHHCGHGDPAAHYISPNVYGEPELYCVQMPSYSVVESKGNQGFLKHWGSPFGCQSVDYYLDVREDHSMGPRAAYLYGRPLPAHEAIKLEWCERCVRLAYNVRINSEARNESAQDWARNKAWPQVSWMGLALSEYYVKHYGK